MREAWDFVIARQTSTSSLLSTVAQSRQLKRGKATAI